MIYSKEEILKKFELVVGLEIHVELSTPTKMFCNCSADWFGKAPNTQTCPVCLGMPGALPVPNKQALLYTIKIAKSLGCKINEYQQFDRKHYFYPDLPKGYQITQFYHPVGVNGKVQVPTKEGGFKTIRINRIHLEEDTGKLIHKGEESLVDFNRSGVPLVEIVTEPDFRSTYEVKAFLKLLRALVRLLGVSDADMEKGSMRLEPNISLRPRGQKDLAPYKVEVKNINSFNFVVKAIEYEILRQGKLLMQGQVPEQQTRGFDPSTGRTVPQRRKEVAQDYRYLPEPDIPPIRFSKSETNPAIPHNQNPFKMYKALADLNLGEDVIWFLIENPVSYRLFMEFSELVAKDSLPKQVKALKIKEKPEVHFAKFLLNSSAKEQFESLEQALEAYVEQFSKDTLDSSTISRVVSEVLAENPQAVADFKAGKQQALQFLMGQFMRKVRKKIDATPVIKEFRKQIEAIN